MFDWLVWEGFCADERLPLGWIFQLTETEVNFLNNEGHFISSLSEAETHFRTRLSSERYEMVQQFLKSFSSDQTLLPVGWRLEEGAETAQYAEDAELPEGAELGVGIQDDDLDDGGAQAVVAETDNYLIDESEASCEQVKT